MSSKDPDRTDTQKELFAGADAGVCDVLLHGDRRPRHVHLLCTGRTHIGQGAFALVGPSLSLSQGVGRPKEKKENKKKNIFLHFCLWTHL